MNIVFFQILNIYCYRIINANIISPILTSQITGFSHACIHNVVSNRLIRNTFAYNHKHKMAAIKQPNKHLYIFSFSLVYEHVSLTTL